MMVIAGPGHLGPLRRRGRPLGRDALLLLALRGRGLDRAVRHHLLPTVRRLAGPLLVLAAAAALFLILGSRTATRRPGPAQPDRYRRRRSTFGRQLFLVHCSSCHGFDAEGCAGHRPLGRSTPARPSADFYLRTGRMPLANYQDQPIRHRPAFPDNQIRALVAYVGSLDGGPAIPVLPPQTDLSQGFQLFSINCAQCHNDAGAGGALGYGDIVPSLGHATSLDAAEAMRIGPSPMPVFGPDTLSDQQVADIAAYVQYLHHPRDRGGLGLGHLGPIPEGFVGLGGRDGAAAPRRPADRHPGMSDPTDRTIPSTTTGCRSGRRRMRRAERRIALCWGITTASRPGPGRRVRRRRPAPTRGRPADGQPRLRSGWASSCWPGTCCPGSTSPATGATYGSTDADREAVDEAFDRGEGVMVRRSFLLKMLGLAGGALGYRRHLPDPVARPRTGRHPGPYHMDQGCPAGDPGRPARQGSATSRSTASSPSSRKATPTTPMPRRS